MRTPQEARRIRLESDYREMLNIRGSIIQWEALSGTGRQVEAYRLTVRVRTVIRNGQGPTSHRDEHTILLTLPPSYPEAAPETLMQTTPAPFHPNWFVGGKWCYGTWIISEGLGHHVIRMIRTLQFDPEITNAESPANRDATEWYLANLSGGCFPCDTQVLPDPTKSRMELLSQKKMFEITEVT
ncbi:MAG: hypothetical protein V1792_03860 [Pseudomonadota bacterium]